MENFPALGLRGNCYGEKNELTKHTSFCTIGKLLLAVQWGTLGQKKICNLKLGKHFRKRLCSDDSVMERRGVNVKLPIIHPSRVIRGAFVMD